MDAGPPGNCDHELRSWGKTGLVACGECGIVEWFGPGGPLDPAEALAALYGSYDLVGPLPAIGAPAAEVLVYRPHRARRGALSILPTEAWLPAGPDLWLATDGQVLLLATPNPVMVENLTQGA